jgi:hypothetical protein
MRSGGWGRAATALFNDGSGCEWTHYWLGTSRSSANKDAALANIAATVANANTQTTTTGSDTSTTTTTGTGNAPIASLPGGGPGSGARRLDLEQHLRREAGASLTGTEGAALTGVTVATFSDANPNATVNDFTATITWGDGGTSAGTVVASGNGFAVTGTHTYADEGSYQASVAITDDGGSTASASTAVTVNDAALTAAGAPLTGTEGAALTGVTVATFSDANPNATVNDFTATITWGDGGTSAGTVVASGNGFAITGTEGAALTGVTVATFSDANPNATVNDFTVTINWGDTTTSAGTVVVTGNGFAVTGTHTYADEGSYQASVAIIDDGGSTASASTTVTVNDAALTAAATAPLTATDAAPVSTWYANSLVASTGQTFAASNLFTATDADNDGITQYDFWDTGAGNGHWFVNGLQQGSNQEIMVNASQLSQVTYRAGTGTDTLYVRANDGLQWGAWANMTTPFTASGGTPQPSSVTVSAGGGVEIATAASSTNASFASNTGTLKLDDSRDYTGTVVGLVGQDSLDLADINFIIGTTTATLMNATSAGGTLQVTDGTNTANIALLGNYTASVFVTESDGHGGTTVPGFIDGAPVSTWCTNSLVASTGQTFAASNLFTATDADGDSITQYDFYDTGAGNGHWFVNGVAQGSNQEILVNASQLSLVSYHAGTGTDTLYVRANDGLQWGAWTNLTTPFTASGGSQPSSVTVPAGGGVEIATAASSTNASFASNTGTLKLDDSRDYTGTVVGLVGQDSLDLADINYATVQTPTYLNQTSSGETVRVTDGTHTANIALLGNYMASVFTTSPDGNGGTNIVDPPILGGQPVIAPPHA